MSPTAHTILSDRYALAECGAGGGIGEVWAATDAILGRAVAVELMGPALSQQHGFLDRCPDKAAGSLAVPAWVVPQRTRAVPAQVLPTEPPGKPDRRSGLGPAWFLAGAGEGPLAALGASAPPDRREGTQTSVTTTTTSPTVNRNTETSRNSATTEIEPAANNSSMPGQPYMTKDTIRGHHDTKDGK
jgi:hypothetical protein